MPNEGKGKLIIIGGAEDKTGDCQILREFIRSAGGIEARIAALTAATSSPREAGDTYMQIFEQLGVENVRVVHTRDRAEAGDRAVLESINQATGIFFTGGEQARITSLLKDTPLDEALHQRFAQGATIAGTSAGAAIMPDMAILEGDSETNPRPNAVLMAPGMGFLPGVVVDQHFAQRGRLGRLLSALAQQPAVLGFGIDENTAVVVDGDRLEVIGAGAVTVVDVSEITHCNLKTLLKDEALAICGAKLHVLPHGYKFDLKARSPILNPAAAAA